MSSATTQERQIESANQNQPDAKPVGKRSSTRWVFISIVGGGTEADRARIDHLLHESWRSLQAAVNPR